MLKNAQTYEIMNPVDVGVTGTAPAGKLPGATRSRQVVAGLPARRQCAADAFRASDLADKKKHIFDADIIALVDDW
jgi:2-isopropylmalate synthase